jgi:hypothetical protein
MLIALAYMTDAILELKTDDLEKIGNCIYCVSCKTTI